MRKITNKRSASATINGFTFQIDSAIHLFLNNIKTCSYIAIEGENDISYYDSTGLHVVQAKSSEKEKAIKDKIHINDIYKALDSFEMEYEVKPIDYKIIFNYFKPISSLSSFEITKHDIKSFLKLVEEDKNKIADYYNSKAHSRYLLSNTYFEYVPYGIDSNRREYIENEFVTFINGLLSEETGEVIDEHYIYTSWFDAINNNGVEDDDMLSKDELAGYAFNYLRDTNSRFDIYLKYRKTIIVGKGINNDEVISILKKISDIPISIRTNNKVRSWAYEQDIDINKITNKELDNYLDSYVLIGVINNEIPSMIRNLTKDNEELKNEVFRRYVAMIIFNTNLIDNIKGGFGYEN